MTTPTARPLAGRGAVITGASQGLGEAIARSFVAAGADVLLAARDAVQLEATRRSLSERAATTQRVLAHPADVSKEDDVAALTAYALKELPAFQILVNNAGVYGPMGPIESVDWHSWVQAIEINLFGSVLMCRAVVPHLRRRGGGKIIQLSGGGATKPLPRLSAYAASKAAVVRFAETLAEEVAADRIDVNAIAPGMLNTRLLDEVIAGGPDAVGPAFYARALEQKAGGGTPLLRGAELCVFLASAASDGITGKLIAAVWDPWEQFDDYRGDLIGTDVYTLRRITPKDRGLSWGGE
jgi:NAD(P)-dependent dehydrogenase (short-subunit alcohol dehydrogenase family)